MKHNLIDLGHNALTGGGTFGRLTNWLHRFETKNIREQTSEDAASYDEVFAILRKKSPSDEMVKADFYRAYVSEGITSIAGAFSPADARDLVTAVEKSTFEISNLTMQIEILIESLNKRNRNDLTTKLEGMSLDGLVAVIHCIRMHLFFESIARDDVSRPLLVDSFPIIWTEKCPFCEKMVEVDSEEQMKLFCDCGAIGRIYLEGDHEEFISLARDILGTHRIEFHEPIMSMIHEPFAKWYVSWGRKETKRPSLIKEDE